MNERISIMDQRPKVKSQNGLPKIQRKKNHSKTKNSPVDRILFLQRTAGNQAVQKLIKSGALQAKLRIGQPGDTYEQEADRVAEQVMRMPEPHVVSSGTPYIHSIQRAYIGCEDEVLSRQPIEKEKEDELRRQPIEEEEEELQAKATSDGISEVNTDIESHIQNIRGGGQPLSESDRAYFEPRFGQDFSQVRVHSDSKAAESARAVNARAFTVGKDVIFGTGHYSETSAGQKLLAHELMHVVQQGGAVLRPMRREGSRPSTAFQRTSEQAISQVSDVIQRAGDPAAIPPGFRCPTDLTPGRPAGTDVLFLVGRSNITPAHKAQLTTFRTTWLTAGGTDDILVHGYASTDGEQGPNWTLSCDRAEAVQTELEQLGIPTVRIRIVAHGESTDFGSSRTPNRHAVVSSHSAGYLPLVIGNLTPRDNFASRSTTRFGVGEIIDLSFSSFPYRPAADFGGLRWHHATGGGTLASDTNVGTATYTAPATADAARLVLRVTTGATAGRVISAHAITIVIPSGVNMVTVPGTAPNFGGWGNPPISAGTWGAGFQANVFVDPKDVSFRGVVFGEGTVAGVVTPAGSFLSGRHGLMHPANTFGPAHGGDATTGTAVSPPRDGISHSGGVTVRRVFGVPICGTSDFLWAIPWEFRVAGGARTPFDTANQHATSTLSCNATVEKAGAGPHCRRINGTIC